MTYARAGHTPLLYLPGGCADDARRIQVLAPDGLVLGLKIDDGAAVRAPARGADAAASRRRRLHALHRRHHRGDERR